MYPAVRAVGGILGGNLQSELSILDPHVSRLRVWPWDADMYLELNHARTLTLFELGRWQVVGRMRLLSVLRRERIAFAIAGASVRYRRPVPIMARVEMITRFVGWDDRFFYVDQSLWLEEECASQALLRAALRSDGRTLPPDEFLALLGAEVRSPQLPGWVSAWIDAEQARPWPPARGRA
jgi:acyl-CoA thioesterase FadM